MKKIYYSLFTQTAFAKSILPERDWANLQFADIMVISREIMRDFILPVLAAVAVLMLIIGAYNYLTAYGNEEKAEKGKKTIIWAIAGIAVAILAWVIVNWVWQITAGTTPPQEAAPPY